ncbi:hypothetical protein OIU84_007728 [Salix udensis]|uniref:Uncharacterized protein n=1 Tax=Salix udensis TaxID=889485 RepID=A0AAD6JU81_9ROSI|nr:hypothetical protein OIU84_007728 [Salix udensis]
MPGEDTLTPSPLRLPLSCELSHFNPRLLASLMWERGDRPRKLANSNLSRLETQTLNSLILTPRIQAYQTQMAMTCSYQKPQFNHQIPNPQKSTESKKNQL